MVFIDFSLKQTKSSAGAKKPVQLFKPLRLALMTSTPFTDATPVNRVNHFPFKPRVIKTDNVSLAKTDNVSLSTPDHKTAEAKTETTQTAPTQTQKRVNPLTAMRQLQKRGVVRLDLIRKDEDENKKTNDTAITQKQRSSSQKPKLIKAAGTVLADSERRFHADDGTFVDLYAPISSATDNSAKEKRARPESGLQKYTHYNDGSEDGRRKDPKTILLSPGVGFIFDKEIWSVEDCDIIPARNKCRGDAHTHSGLFCEAATAPGKAYCSSCSSRYFAKNSSQQIKLDEENRKTRQAINSIQEDRRRIECELTTAPDDAAQVQHVHQSTHIQHAQFDLFPEAAE